MLLLGAFCFIVSELQDNSLKQEASSHTVTWMDDFVCAVGQLFHTGCTLGAFAHCKFLEWKLHPPTLLCTHSV